MEVMNRTRKNKNSNLKNGTEENASGFSPEEGGTSAENHGPVSLAQTMYDEIVGLEFDKKGGGVPETSTSIGLETIETSSSSLTNSQFPFQTETSIPEAQAELIGEGGVSYESTDYNTEGVSGVRKPTRLMAADEGVPTPSDEVPSPSQPRSKALFTTRNKWIIAGVIATVAVIAIVVGVSVGATSNKSNGGQTGSGNSPASGSVNEETPKLDVGSFCDSFYDCLNGACALTSYPPSEAGNKSCCASGGFDTLSVSGVGTANYCTEMPLGSKCGADQFCASGSCFQNLCTSAPADEEPCTISSTCNSAPCGYTSANLSTAKMVCCSSGDTVSMYIGGEGNKDVCTGRPTGTFCSYSDGICASRVCTEGLCRDGPVANDAICDTASDCASGACGLPQPANVSTTNTICCSSGVTVGVYIGSEEKDVCTGRPTGTFCYYSDDVCTSRVCTESLCRDGPVANDAICDTASDCASGACGLPQAANVSSTATICCSSGVTVGVYMGSEGKKEVCTGRPTGTFCYYSDDVCASGVCTESLCRDGPVANDAICDAASDCASGACGLPQVANVTTTDMICCSSGGTVSLNVDNLGDKDFCTGRPTGTVCGNELYSDDVCASGSCVSGVCT